jgi:hypothetical protein
LDESQQDDGRKKGKYFPIQFFQDPKNWRLKQPETMAKPV